MSDDHTYCQHVNTVNTALSHDSVQCLSDMALGTWTHIGSLTSLMTDD